MVLLGLYRDKKLDAWHFRNAMASIPSSGMFYQFCTGRRNHMLSSLTPLHTLQPFSNYLVSPQDPGRRTQRVGGPLFDDAGTVSSLCEPSPTPKAVPLPPNTALYP